MGFLEKLNASRDSSISAVHEFLLEYKKHGMAVHAFFEGHDDASFYSAQIRRALPQQLGLYLHQCGNKDAVYQTFASIDGTQFSNCILLFFVDKDYSNFLTQMYTQAPNIYVTEYYSIENYVVTGEILERVWDELIWLKKQSYDFEIVRAKFLEELSRFHNLMLPITAWIVCLKRSGQPVNLDNIACGKIFVFDKDVSLAYHRIQSTADLLAVLEGLCRIVTSEECEKSLHELVDELNNHEPKTIVRGKYELWFFIAFLNQLLANLAVAGARTKVQLTEANAIEVLGPRLAPSPSLDLFLRTNLRSAAAHPP